MMNRIFVLALLVTGSFLLGCGAVENQTPPTEPTAAGDSAADSHGELLVVDDENFGELVLESDKPVLVDFWATWCGPCKMIAPTVEELANEYEGRAVVAKLDVDVAPTTAKQYGVSSIPTLIVFHNGEEVARSVGVVGKSELASKLDAAMSN